jgi:hypothetical protein
VTITAQQFADTLRLLLPGFVAAKTFYALGLQTKRSDAQWVLWSILAAAPVAYLGDFLVPLPGAASLVVQVPLAVALGAWLAVGWLLLSRRWPWLLADQAIRAWDELFTGPSRWIEVTLKNGVGTYLGYAGAAASSVVTDDLDLLLLKPALVQDSQAVDLPGVESILVRREDIALIVVHAPAATSGTPRANTDQGGASSPAAER